jgi:kynurenine formamidase
VPEWGPEDELGALNEITPETIVVAAGLVREGRALSLAFPIDDSPRRPRLPHRAAPQHFMNRDGGDHLAGLSRAGGAFISEDSVLLSIHAGTHIDALSHVGAEGEIYNGFPAASITSAGAGRCGMEKVESIVGRGVLLDAAAAAGEACLPPGFEIDVALLERACEHAQVTPRAGDIVYVRCGWLSGHRELGHALEAGEPGIGTDGGVWLAERGVTAIAMDNFGIEPYGLGSADAPRGIPVHVELIRNRGLYLLEFCDLEVLASLGRSEFLTVIAPLRITGGVGSPVNPIAIL